MVYLQEYLFIDLGSNICKNILFIHAILGCDSTSRLFGLGKGLALKKFQSDRAFKQQSKIFTKKRATQESIIIAGEKALVILYGGSEPTTLDELRYTKFCEKVSKSTSQVEPHSLPPTSAAAKHHSLCVFYQVNEWKNDCNDMNPEDWGWCKKEERCMPVMINQPAAPTELLDVVLWLQE